MYTRESHGYLSGQTALPTHHQSTQGLHNLTSKFIHLFDAFVCMLLVLSVHCWHFCLFACVGTDRNNMVEILGPNENYPVPFEQSTMWNNAEIKWIHHGKTGVQAKDLAVDLASAGYYRYSLLAFVYTVNQHTGELISAWKMSQKYMYSMCIFKRMYIWWSLCTLYLHICQGRVATGDSGLCCCTCVTSFKHVLVLHEHLGPQSVSDFYTVNILNRLQGRLLHMAVQWEHYSVDICFLIHC